MPALGGRAELRALADSDANRVQSCARDWQVPRWTEDYRELLDAGQLDAVSVCLPHHLHAPVAIEALQAGLHTSWSRNRWRPRWSRPTR